MNNNPEADAQRSYAHAELNYKTERESVLRRLSVTPLGFCLRVIVNDKLLILEKTTSIVLTVMFLIYGIYLRK